jgi:hypothetical protein
VRFVVSLHDIGTDATPLRHSQPRISCPRPNRRTIDPGRSRRLASPAPTATPHPPTPGDERRQRVGQPGPVRLPQIDLVAHPVQAEAHGLRSRRTIEIIRDYHRDIPRHKHQPSERTAGGTQRDTPPEGIRVHTEYRSHGWRRWRTCQPGWPSVTGTAARLAAARPPQAHIRSASAPDLATVRPGRVGHR